MNVSFLYVWLLALIPFVLWLERVRHRRGVPTNISWRSEQFGTTWRLLLRRGLPWLRGVGVTLLIVAAAGPFDWREVGSIPAEGVAIELVVDRSGSMLADDYFQNGERITRLEAVTRAAGRFITGDGEADARTSDLIGLVAFAAEAEVACPMTLDQEAVVAELERTNPAADYRDDGTAIGDGWGLAIAELQRFDNSPAGKNTSDTRIDVTPVTKVAILLTDGQQTSGQLTPEQAAALAKHYGVRTYVIGLEPQAIQAEAARDRIAQERDRLNQLARSTGGRFYVVSDFDALQDVYDEINALERTVVGEQSLRVRQHFAVASFNWGPYQIPPLILLTLVLLVADTGLRWTLLREVS